MPVGDDLTIGQRRKKRSRENGSAFAGGWEGEKGGFTFQIDIDAQLALIQDHCHLQSAQVFHGDQ